MSYYNGVGYRIPSEVYVSKLTSLGNYLHQRVLLVGLCLSFVLPSAGFSVQIYLPFVQSIKKKQSENRTAQQQFFSGGKLLVLQCVLVQNCFFVLQASDVLPIILFPLLFSLNVFQGGDEAG